MYPGRETLINFTKHYADDVQVVSSIRGTNMAAINIGDYHLEVSNSETSPTIFCDVYHHYTRIGSYAEKDTQKLHALVDDTIAEHNHRQPA